MSNLGNFFGDDILIIINGEQSSVPKNYNTVTHYLKTSGIFDNWQKSQ